jgi:hypothetical protein
MMFEMSLDRHEPCSKNCDLLRYYCVILQLAFAEDGGVVALGFAYLPCDVSRA